MVWINANPQTLQLNETGPYCWYILCVHVYVCVNIQYNISQWGGSWLNLPLPVHCYQSFVFFKSLLTNNPTEHPGLQWTRSHSGRSPALTFCRVTRPVMYCDCFNQSSRFEYPQYFPVTTSMWDLCPHWENCIHSLSSLFGIHYSSLLSSEAVQLCNKKEKKEKQKFVPRLRHKLSRPCCCKTLVRI